MKRKISILGSTGSIGKSLINILKKDLKNFDVSGYQYDQNIDELIKQIKIFEVKNIIVTNKGELIVKDILKNKKINIYNNFNHLNKIYGNKKNDYTMNAISGLDGLEPTLKIIKFSKKIAIANKESIICPKPPNATATNANKAKFIPIDSEHFSIWSLNLTQKIKI